MGSLVEDRSKIYICTKFNGISLMRFLVDHWIHRPNTIWGRKTKTKLHKVFQYYSSRFKDRRIVVLRKEKFNMIRIELKAELW